MVKNKEKIKKKLKHSNKIKNKFDLNLCIKFCPFSLVFFSLTNPFSFVVIWVMIVVRLLVNLG